MGVGTGRNLNLYSRGSSSPASTSRTGCSGERAGCDLTRLDEAAVQQLPFEGGTFDTVTATCVFCSVADPVRGLREISRVVKPDGEVLLIEHVRPRNRVLGWLADVLTPLTRRLLGPEINRRTEENVAAAGLEIVDIRRPGRMARDHRSAGRIAHDVPAVGGACPAVFERFSRLLGDRARSAGPGSPSRAARRGNRGWRPAGTQPRATLRSRPARRHTAARCRRRPPVGPGRAH